METPRVSRSSSRRQPLGDAALRANIETLTPRAAKPGKKVSHIPESPLPRHESLAANGALTVRNATSSPQRQRRSTPTYEELSDSKRSSQVSTTSTNASAKGRKRKTHIGPWQLGNDIGKGGCGKVRKVRHSITGQNAAAKIISKKVAEKARAESLMSLVERSKKSQSSAVHVMPFGIEREIVIMKLLEHQNVVRLYDLWENREEMYLIMEYVDGGELFEYVEQRGCLEEDETVWLFRQVVAALLHCHRIGIHHRDLKPENILLERESLQVKLVDFGMAALQPKGKHLTTPCGSVHYAAPEVFEKNYDGSKVDVWSLGVILYVMLMGTTPFQYEADMKNDVGKWYRLIKAGKFTIHEELSDDAKDLVQKMLVPDARRRITLEGVWNHPLIHKYETEWGEDKDSGKLENWIGPRPVIGNWTLHSHADIDREILRNLKTLWHSEKEETLIQRLLSKEPNQEKYFYYTLQKYQDEQLENYAGGPDGVYYSVSDYHHLKRNGPPPDIPPLPPSAYSTEQSTFSIMKDEPRNMRSRSKSSLRKPAPSERSYDPFRASRSVIGDGKENYDVTIHGDMSSPNQKRSPTSTTAAPGSSRAQSSLRIVAANKHQRLTVGSSRSSLLKSRSSLRPVSSARRSMSRSSMGTGSSLYPSSPPGTAVIKVPTRKRGVDFSHIRRSSTTSALTDKNIVVNKTTHSSSKVQLQNESLMTSSNPSFSNVIKSKKENQTLNKSMSTARSQTTGRLIENEARKLSTELEKFCEEAFFRTSTDSSKRTSNTSHVASDTPPSSVSNHISGTKETRHKQQQQQTETPKTFLTRELAETRNRLAARYAADEGTHSAAYNDILTHLDALLKPSTASSNIDGRRTSSAPDSKTSEYSDHLPVISEEDRFADAPEGAERKGKSRMNIRAVTNPETQGSRAWLADPKSTIRVIEPTTSPPRIAPLVIRKASGASQASPRSPGEASRYYSHTGKGNKDLSKVSPNHSSFLHSIDEEGLRVPQTQDERTALPRKRGWFHRFGSAYTDKSEKAEKHKRDVGKKWEDLDDRLKRSRIEEAAKAKRYSDPRSLQSNVSKEGETGLPGKRPGFLRFWTKHKSPKRPEKTMALGGADDDEITNSIVSGQSSLRQKQGGDSDRELGVQRNWLARFLNIKPASRALTFCVGRGKARQELVRLLRSWKTYGMRDVVLDRERNLVFGRLGSANHLGIKEVSFVAELFIVLVKGQHAQLSIVRFTQRKGAASSFRRVIDTLEEVFSGRGLLVEDTNRRAAMESLLLG